MKTVQLFLYTALVLIISGCRGSEPLDNIVRASNPKAFNYVVPISQRGVSDIQENVGYYIVFDDEAMKANITIANLLLPGESQPMTMTFTDVDMGDSFNNHVGQRVVRSDVLISSDPVTSGFTITDVTFVYSTTNSLDPNDLNGIYARYTVNGQYVVTAYPYNIIADGTTRIDNLTEGGEFIDYTPCYRIVFDPERMLADVYTSGLTVGGEVCDFSIRGVRLNLTEDGYTLVSCEKTIVGSETGVDVVDFSAEADLLDELRLRFTLKNDSGEFDVAAFLLPSLS